jgi:8-oxo-dGTP diphosphatase
MMHLGEIPLKRLVKVVAAIIDNEQGKISCALRSPQMSMPNMWEFPGGKVEEMEDIFSALEREIDEELGCKIETAKDIFNETIHEYDTFNINLLSIKCKVILGVPTPSEHSKLIWLKKENLASLKWAPADIPAIEQLIQEK